jgi:hypothetical protein
MCAPAVQPGRLLLNLHVNHAMLAPDQIDAMPSQREGQGFESPCSTNDDLPSSSDNTMASQADHTGFVDVWGTYVAQRSGQVQRVGVVVSPSVGSPKALIGITSYTSYGGPPEVGAP